MLMGLRMCSPQAISLQLLPKFCLLWFLSSQPRFPLKVIRDTEQRVNSICGKQVWKQSGRSRGMIQHPPKSIPR